MLISYELNIYSGFRFYSFKWCTFQLVWWCIFQLVYTLHGFKGSEKTVYFEQSFKIWKLKRLNGVRL